MPDHPEYRTPQILPDNPLQEGETAHFHFDKFAVTLARLIADKDTQTPLTIGISGSWGTGKTTLLRRLEGLLKEPWIGGGITDLDGHALIIERQVN